ncbi:MAG: hypothetical protein ACT4PY_16385, partial [Armatimonadota bacterium]
MEAVVSHVVGSQSPRQAPLCPLVRAGRRVIGKLIVKDGRRVFLRRVRWDKHFFRLLGGWSASLPVLNQLQALRVDGLCYLDDTGGVWEVDLDRFLQLSIRRNFDELQLILPLRFW